VGECTLMIESMNGQILIVSTAYILENQNLSKSLSVYTCNQVNAYSNSHPLPT
jgi:hypothetical protein